MAYPNDGAVKPCYFFDLDGTLADLSHRLPHIQKEPKDWDAFFDGCDCDQPIRHMIHVCYALSRIHPIVIVSGRSDRVRKQTETWLRDWGIPHSAIYMRPSGDHRPDYALKKILLKQAIADGWDPLMAFDDRDQVVKMWREQGIPCAQVADGNF